MSGKHYPAEVIEEVVKHYLDDHSSYECSDKFNIPSKTIREWAKKRGISRSNLEGNKLRHSKLPKGRMFNAGGYIVTSRGKITGNGQRQYEHRLIVEIILGRKLKKGEMVHHINGIKSDNRNCNLLVCTNSYHKSIHERMSELYMKEHFTQQY
jgi:hypothetical protein